MTVSVGSVFAGRYEVTAPIATGGMGEVWQARDRTLGRVIALKVLRTEYAGDSSFLIRFRNEARHTAGLSHPNIASVYDYGEGMVEGQRLAYLVMEYVEGKPLVTLLAEFGRLTAAQTLDVLEQAGEGLSAAHEAGVVHRDIKPGNLLVRPDGVVKLTDFGIARARDAVPLTRTGMVVGTAQYLSPEQAQGFTVTPASDVYSLGVVAYECLAGVRPFDGESQVAIALAQINRPPPPLPADVPPAVRALVDRALAKDPADRFTDGGDFADSVRAVAHGGAAPATGHAIALDPDAVGTTVLPAAAPATGPRTGLGTGLHTGARTGPRTTVPPLPPLQGPPADDDDPDGWRGDGEEEQPRSSRAKYLWIAALVAVLLVVGGGIALLTSGGGKESGDGGGGSDATASGSASPTDPLVNTATYVGRPYREVVTELQAMKLTVTTEPASDEQLAEVTEALDAGDVVTTDPFQQAVQPGSAVTVFFTEEARAGSTASRTATDSASATATTTGAAPSDAAPGTGGGAAPTVTSSRTTRATQTTAGTTAATTTTGASTTTAAPTNETTTNAPTPTTTQPTEPTLDAVPGALAPAGAGAGTTP